MKVCHVLLDADAAKTAAAVLRGAGKGDVVVVAPGKALCERFDAALHRQLVGREDAYGDLLSIGAFLKGLAPDDAFASEADAAVERIHTVLCQGMSLSFRDNSLTDYLRAMLVQLSGQCFASILAAGASVDGREVILSESNNGIPVIDWVLTEKTVKTLPDAAALKVVAGSYGRKVTGETVSLGHAGSELTASLFAAVLGAGAVRYYVPGFSYAESAVLTYDEAAQRFSSGEPVYPPAMQPARKAGIPAEIVDPAEDGKVVLTIAPVREGVVAKGITGVVRSGAMDLLTVYGSGLLGSVGISSALFGVLARSGVNIHFISQSLSEYSISFAVKRSDGEKAVQALETLLADTASRSAFADLSYTVVPVEIVSVFGQGMRSVPGISGKVYSALGNAGVNVVAASQGGEELSISIVVGEADAQRAKEALERL